MEMGVPYQTLISGIIHRYIEGELVSKNGHPSQKLKSSLHFNGLSQHRFKGYQILIRPAV